MRILHTADIHLAPRLDWILDAERRRQRRADVAAQIDRIPILVREHAVNAVVLAGDIFDRDLPALPEVVRLCLALEDAAVPVMVVPGTHDPSHSGGIWDRAWPANVHVFDRDEWQSFVVGDTAFYGIACTGRPRAEPLFQGVPLVDSRFQVGVAHASLVWSDIVDKVDRKKYPFVESELATAPFQYLALGDYHQMRVMREGKVTVAYPGTPEGIALDKAEAGARHMLLVELADPATAPVVTPIQTNTKEVLIEEINVEELQHEHSEDAVEQVRKTLMAQAKADRLARFDLVGILHHPLALDEERLIEECRPGYFVLEVSDRTKLLREAPLETNTIRAVFERRLAERLASATDEQELEVIKRAQRLGVQALEGLL
jgi:DNA repair exonuclease SbcCD nuclease subunit